MSKIIKRGVLFLVVTVVITVALITVRSPFGKENSSFDSVPKKEITRIEFSTGNEILKLEKVKGQWLVNGRTEARKSAVLFIERILREIRIKSPVTDELFVREIVEKGIIPVKVKVYERNRLLKSFIVYRTPSNLYGNIMKIREGTKPFIVYVPGYDGDIGAGFVINELFWRTYTIFNLLPSEISDVKFENIPDSSASFSIVCSPQNVNVTGLHGEEIRFDTTRLKRYLTYFTHIPFEKWAFETGLVLQGHILLQNPVYVITVTSTEGKTTVLRLWKKNGDDGDPESVDTDRLWGKTDERDEFFVIRYFDIDPIIKKRSYFIAE